MVYFETVSRAFYFQKFSQTHFHLPNWCNARWKKQFAFLKLYFYEKMRNAKSINIQPGRIQCLANSFLMTSYLWLIFAWFIYMTVLVTSSDVYKEQYGYSGSPSLWVFIGFLCFIKTLKNGELLYIYKAIGYYIPFELTWWPLVTTSDPVDLVTRWRSRVTKNSNVRASPKSSGVNELVQ